jgi:general secretion pathway protein N
MPFLFVDQLVVRAPFTSSTSRNGQTAASAGIVPAMAGGRAVLRLTIGIVVLALSSHGVRALNVNVTDEPSYDARPVESPAETAISDAPAVRGQAVETPLAPMQGRPPSGNPLWAIPLTALSGTRQRPIFSSSRRPPPPAVALAPVVKPAPVAPKPKEPERPKLTLVGTVAGGHERFGIFLDQSTKAALRLRMGDDYQGWRLRSVLGREATLEKDQETVILALPQSGAGQPAGDVRSPLSNATTLVSATSPRRERPSH